MTLSDADVLAAVAARRDEALRTVRFVHAHPELAHEERRCSAHLAQALAGAGFAVETGIAGMETAFLATFTGAEPGRTVGIVALYDAVATVGPDGEPVPMHCCGHGPIAGGVLAAASALAALGDRLPGRVVVVGCPADEIHAPLTQERGGGKALTAAAGVWDDVDAALYAHPEFMDTVIRESLWMRRQRVRVAASRSLRADADQPPLDAFRTVAAIVAESDPGRVMLERVVLDGDVEEGTGLVLTATFLLFSPTEEELETAVAGLRARFAAGEWTEGPKVAGVRPDDGVTAAVADAFRAAGGDFVADPPPLPFATDFGNISHRVPAALVGVGRDGGWAFHTSEGEAQFTGPEGDRVAMRMAEVLALATVRLADPGPAARPS
ncbi:MAG: M20/M25/M40 family metallo-hydrolase [Thermoleophilia bacterium]